LVTVDAVMLQADFCPGLLVDLTAMDAHLRSNPGEKVLLHLLDKVLQPQRWLREAILVKYDTYDGIIRLTLV
jgi:hypothetical protein